MSAALTVMTAVPAYAHEARDVGQFKVEAGWAVEPPFAGYTNAVQFLLHDANDQPIADLGDTLKVRVSSGGETSDELSLEPAFGEDFGEPGDYRADIIPTRPGKYTFHFTGTIRGQNVDESFTSSDTTFDDVKDATEAEFPAKDPSTGELAQRVGRLDTRLAAAQSAASAVKSDVDDAKTMATIGIVLGAIGIIAAIGMGAVAMRRRT
jgi:hypothetical protein